MSAEQVRLGFGGTLRWIWRTLTTMRTALILLFLLGVAAVPGSVLPQRGQADAKVNTFLEEHAQLGPWLDRFAFFDVYGSPWFASIYLLLMLSLSGCIVPRTRQHLRALRTPPSTPPAVLSRLSQHREFEVAAADVPAALARVEHWLRAHRFRVRADNTAGWISADKGLLKETGNLVFHIAMMVLLLGVAQGSLLGYRGQVIVREGSGFSNVVAQYDSFVPGRFVAPDSLEPFAVHLDDFVVRWDDIVATGMPQPTEFRATLTTSTPAGEGEQVVVQVNEPLDINGVSMYLVGHGYAPHLRVTDENGDVVFDDSVIFLPRDGNFTSDGVVKIPDADPAIGLDAIFAPTGTVTAMRGPHSTYPDLREPQIYMSAWIGDLGLDDGVPQNVYELDTSGMTRIGFEELEVGESWTLPKGHGTVTLVGVDRFATFNIGYDPGQTLALTAAIIMLAGLLAMLYVQRRRYWVRGKMLAPGRVVLEIGGLGKSEATDLSAELAAIAAAAEKEQ